MTQSRPFPAEPSCLLGGLGDPRLSGVVPGLVLSEYGELLIERQHFACCDGRGHRLDAHKDLTHACALGSRLRETRRVAAQWARLMRSEDASGLQRELAAGQRLGPHLGRLAEIAKRQTRRGLAWTAVDPLPTLPGATASARAVPGPLPTPSVWAVAFAAAWRFGLRPHVVVLGKSEPADLLPKRAAGAPDLLLIGNVDGLWDAYAAEGLDALIGYAYGALTPVFLELAARKTPPASASAAGAASTRSAFSQRIGRMKARSPLTWLPPDCLARVAEVTDGLAQHVATAASDQELAGGRPSRGKASGMPKLPWDP